ncbi:hypothetical protein HMPREF9630_01631 [Peptoanaerobacter stomatis]|uniref:PF12822 family protein n=1 Tax=Peptoanaerobacter stomatis TaxID=796937 RepID=V9HUM1_9FIRM|nr:ECF transporter S component [Peptoanaerobacter stomatis]EHL17495.1 hypothetical protein HMPREF9630_01631 [Peptoanaerobacter stomatis]
MKNNTYLKNVILSGFFIAVGVILPMIFHLLAAGKVLLPMHIPVLLGGLLLNPLYALSAGVVTPLLSSLLTGMPPAFPILPIMMAELGAYGFVASILHVKLKLNYVVSLIISMIVGRIVAGIVVSILINVFSVKLPPFLVYIQGAVITGLPGIIIQLIFIPAIMFAIKKYENNEAHI